MPGKGTKGTLGKSDTEFAKRGVPLKSIMQHGRWKSLRTVLEYIEEGRSFLDSPLKALFE